MGTKTQTEADIEERVLRDIAKDRRAAYAEHEALLAERRSLIQARNAIDVPIVERQVEAEAAIRVHARREALPGGRVNKGHRARLEADLSAARAAVDAARKATDAAVQPLVRRTNACMARIAEVDVEWRIQVRRAAAAGVTVADLWTPEGGTPAAVEPAEEGLAVVM